MCENIIWSFSFLNFLIDFVFFGGEVLYEIGRTEAFSNLAGFYLLHVNNGK